MAINDPVVLVLEADHDLPWYLQRGNETFFDEKQEMRRWFTWQAATEWCEAELGVTPLDHLPEPVQSQSRRSFDTWKESGQRRLL